MTSRNYKNFDEILSLYTDIIDNQYLIEEKIEKMGPANVGYRRYSNTNEHDTPGAVIINVEVHYQSIDVNNEDRYVRVLGEMKTVREIEGTNGKSRFKPTEPFSKIELSFKEGMEMKMKNLHPRRNQSINLGKFKGDIDLFKTKKGESIRKTSSVTGIGQNSFGRRRSQDHELLNYNGWVLDKKNEVKYEILTELKEENPISFQIKKDGDVIVTSKVKFAGFGYVPE